MNELRYFWSLATLAACPDPFSIPAAWTFAVGRTAVALCRRAIAPEGDVASDAASLGAVEVSTAWADDTAISNATPTSGATAVVNLRRLIVNSCWDRRPTD